MSLKNEDLAPAGGKNKIQIFSNLRVSTFWKSMMSCPNRWLLAKNWGILQTRMDQRGDDMKTNFEYFQIQKWMPQTISAEKADGKNGVICLVSIYPPKIMVLKLSKKCIFCNFVLTSARNLSILKQFTYIHLKGLVAHFLEMVLFIMLRFTVSEIRVWSQKTLLNFCRVSIFFDILIANISWT